MGIYDGVSSTIFGLLGKTAGIYTVTRTVDANASELYVRVFGNDLNLINSVEISRIKLELGTKSTLANDPPADYSEQLAICGPVVATTAPTNYIGQDGQWQVY